MGNAIGLGKAERPGIFGSEQFPFLGGGTSVLFAGVRIRLVFDGRKH